MNRYRARKQNAPVVEKVSRDKVIERDFSTCYLCNRLLSPDEIALDHIVPLSKNGTHTEDNLAVTCDRCNKSKGNKSLLIFIATRVPFD